MSTTTYKFWSDTNLSIFVESLDYKIPGNMYEVDYGKSCVVIKGEIPSYVERQAKGLGADKMDGDKIIF